MNNYRMIFSTVTNLKPLFLLQGLLYLLIVASEFLISQAAPAYPTITNIGLHSQNKEVIQKLKSLRFKNLKPASKPVSNKRCLCNYEWVVSAPELNRFPRQITEAKCQKNDKRCVELCTPLIYNLPVRITNNDGTKTWKSQPIAVAFIPKL